LFIITNKRVFSKEQKSKKTGAIARKTLENRSLLETNA
jgi:hypothetical protein